jgi:hypothetical protein
MTWVSKLYIAIGGAAEGSRAGEGGLSRRWATTRILVPSSTRPGDLSDGRERRVRGDGLVHSWRR